MSKEHLLYISCGKFVNGQYWVGLHLGLDYGFNKGFKTKKAAIRYAKHFKNRMEGLEIRYA